MDVRGKLNNGEYKNTFEYKDNKEAYRNEECRLEALFKSDLLEEVEKTLGKTLTVNQYDAMFRKACNDGHSSGYYEVINSMFDLIEVITPFLVTK
jgi:hypothetical protein